MGPEVCESYLTLFGSPEAVESPEWSKWNTIRAYFPIQGLF